MGIQQSERRAVDLREFAVSQTKLLSEALGIRHKLGLLGGVAVDVSVQLLQRLAAAWIASFFLQRFSGGGQNVIRGTLMASRLDRRNGPFPG